jgi:hypothetical protein
MSSVTPAAPATPYEEFFLKSICTLLPTLPVSTFSGLFNIRKLNGSELGIKVHLAISMIAPMLGNVTGAALEVGLKELNSRSISVVSAFAGSALFAYCAGDLFGVSFAHKALIAAETGLASSILSFVVEKDETAHSIAGASVSLGATACYAKSLSDILSAGYPEAQNFTLVSTISSWVASISTTLTSEVMISEGNKEQASKKQVDLKV